MKTINKEIIGKILDYCQSNPFVQKRFVVDGFAFHVYFDKSSGYFRVGMFFTPGWGHSNGFSCKTRNEFFYWMEELITDAKKIFVDGGRYPDDYYDKDCGVYYSK